MNKKISYDELEDILIAYKGGSAEASERLIDQFEGYFQKFLNVLHHKRFDIIDDTQRNFIKLFIRDSGARQNIHMFRRSEYVRRAAYATNMNIRAKLSHLEVGDLKNEMVCLFLELARKHDGSAQFGFFIGTFFPLRLQSLVIRLIEADTSRTEVPYDEEDPEVAHYDDIDLDAIDQPNHHIHSTSRTDYDENWVNGYTCSDMLKELTTYERRLLKLYYEWKTFDKRSLPRDIYIERRNEMKCNESDLAEIFGCSRKTINFKRNEVKKLLEDIVLDLHLIER